MSTAAPQQPATGTEPPPSPERALRRLFLALFLRGHSMRGLERSGAPRSIASKLARTLLLYALIGMVAFVFVNQPVFALSIYLHGLTFAFLGMFVASSAGEILFNKQEADILLHRPVSARMLLWAKVRVLVDVSLWLAAAFNLAGFLVGTQVPDGGILFVPAHAFSIALEALFCTSTVIMIYQLCLRWCGRERLENLMTAAQIVVSVGAVLASQILPRLVMQTDGKLVDPHQQPWWIALLPPAWFAGIDDVLVAGFSFNSCLLALAGLAATAVVSWLALGRLAGDYEQGLQTIGETVSRRGTSAGRRWLDALVDRPPLSWTLRDPVTRASFLLVAAYLVRDRDVKLRLYPGLAPLLVIPVMMLLPGRNQGDTGGFGVAVCGAYVGLAPMMGLAMLQFSQQFQASDVFRSAPLAGPAAICAGARQAVLWLLAVPALLAMIGLILLLRGNLSHLPLLLPGILTLPIYLLIPSLGGRGAPLSLPIDEAKGAGRGVSFIGATVVSFALAGLASFSWTAGFFWPLIAAELAVVAGLYLALRRAAAAARWPRGE
jgi:hypothetical protein